MKSKPDRSDEFEVEHIIDHRVVRGNDQYLIKWKGFNSDENSCEPASNLNCPQLLQDYWQHTVRTRDLKPMKIPSSKAYKSPSHFLPKKVNENATPPETDTIITPSDNELSENTDSTVELMTPPHNCLDNPPVAEQPSVAESPDRLATHTQPKRST